MVIPRHIAYIMDGNGRWAKDRGLPRSAGHKAGFERIQPILRVCRDIGVEIVSVFGWSTENWNRPYGEVNYILQALEKKLPQLVKALDKENVRFIHSGNINRLASHAQELLKWGMQTTKNNGPFTFNLAFNYGGREEIVYAVRKIITSKVSPDKIIKSIIDKYLWIEDLPMVDLLIRSGGEKRISNFMLWQIAYAHLYFTDTYWPDFSEREIQKAIQNFNEGKSVNTAEPFVYDRGP